MLLKVYHLLSIDIIMHYRITDTIEVISLFFRCPYGLICFFNSKHFKSMNFIIMYYCFLSKFYKRTYIYSFQHTTCSSVTCAPRITAPKTTAQAEYEMLTAMPRAAPMVEMAL